LNGGANCRTLPQSANSSVYHPTLPRILQIQWVMPENDLRAQKRNMEQKLSEAVSAFERETSLSVTEITLSHASTGSGGGQGSLLKTKVELRS
jgi:hypothetical protein